MRAQGFVLLAAAVALVRAGGAVPNKVENSGCGLCDDCCPDDRTYKKLLDGSETCEKTGEIACGLCSATTANACVITRKLGASVKLLGTVNPSGGGPATAAVGFMNSGNIVFKDHAATDVTVEYVPAAMEDINQWYLPRKNNEGFDFKLTCNQKGGDACDVYIMFYQCYDCDTGAPASLQAALVSDGWRRMRCPPSFVLHPSELNFGFVLYHKEVPKGNQQLTTFAEPIDFASVAWSPKVSLCSSFTTEDACMATGNCWWEDQECVPGWCPKKPIGTPLVPFCPCPLNNNGELRLTN